ncbi:MAG TPA: hypothetical protein DHW38_05160, partial [Planctomycetaceae bacterium]|nr:hypothetical protein [Planctomycetaceae bacterium]
MSLEEDMKHVKLNWLLIWGWLAVPAQVNADDTSFFESKIRPVLVKHCYQCHSSDAKNIKGGLVLDSKDGWQKGGDVGPSIIPGKPTESLLYKAITWQDSDIQMPPDNALPKSVVADFRKWIEDGAVDPRAEGASSGVAVFDLEARRDEHWAWRAYTQSGESKRESVDYYVNRSLRRAGLRASDLATKTELIRRLSFDLTGLPPSKEDLECTSIDDYVDQLLRSPHFGEHWARHWLDVVRFCETKGHVPDADRFYAWKYRDYVVDAFNSDLPFTQFVTEHLAGDLLAPEQQRAGANGVTNISVTATGALFMHDMHFMVVDPVRQRWDQINSQIEMVGKAFLGLTLDCARCHDHKFDAVSQRDYYALAGVFYSTEQGVSRTGPRAANLSEETVAVEKKYREYLNGQIQQRRKAQTPKADGKYFPISEELGIQSPNQVKDVQNLIDQLEELDPSWQHWVRSAKEADITTNVSLLVRGDHRNEGEVIPRGFLTALESESDFPESSSGRMWLAEQITSEKNPLTARVWVNRLWQQLFGHGIVRTPNNFGKLGSAPTHPALLDYLARRLVESDWSMKTVIKEIVMSNAYQRSSEASPKSQENDPANKWLSHQNRRRLNAEQIRDGMLAAAGMLDARIG